MKFKTKTGTVQLTSERRTHIIGHHPIMEDYLQNMKDVLEKPVEIRYSSHSDDVLLFYSYFDKIEDGKYIVVVVNKKEKTVTTAYLSHRIKSGRIYVKEE